MKCLFLRIAIHLFVFTLSLHGQDGNLLFHHLTLQDGLSDQSNQYVYKDSRGFIWISSVNGLNRFDGSRVKVYVPDMNDSTSIEGEIIQSDFFEDSLHKIWFCTYEAINCYDPHHDSFSHYRIPDDNHEPIPGYHIFHMDGTSNLWFILEGKGLFTFNTRSKDFEFKCPLALNAMRAVAVERIPGKVQTIYSYRSGYEGIEQINVDAQNSIASKSILHLEKDNLPVSPKEITNDADSILWITGKTRLIKYNLLTKYLAAFPSGDLLSIEKMNDSILLMSIDEKGVWEFNKRTNELANGYVHQAGNALSPLSDRVSYISKDRDNGIWLSSSEYGLSYADHGKKKFNFITPDSGQKQNVSKFDPVGFYEDDGNNVFCSTSLDGLYTLNRKGEALHRWDKEVDQLQKIYTILRDRQKNTWLSTYGGLALIPAGSKDIVRVSDKEKIMWNGVELSDGRLIFGTQLNGLYQILQHDDSYQLKRIDAVNLDSEYLPLGQDSKGLIWINDKLQKIILIDPVNFSIAAELPVNGVVSNFIENKEKNIAWISSSSGFYEIDTRNYVISNKFEDVDMSSRAGFNNMLQDNHGRLWLSFRNKIMVFDPATKISQTYTQEDGLPNNQFNLYGACKFNDGEMWFASASGITTFYPERIHNIQIQAIPQITSLLINDQIQNEKLVCEKTNATNISEVEKLTFSFRQNTLSFLVNSLEYSAPQHNKVRYKMEGIDKEWIEVASGSLVRYPSLPAGNFTFIVTAANSDGVYSSLMRNMDITITPPFYKTWWFILLSSLAFIALIIYIVYLNFSKTIELQKVRLRLYENLHDDVGSRLTAIVLSAEDLAQNEKYVNPKLVHISHIARSIVNNMRRLVWAIDPENDSMNSLVTKIRYDKTLILDEKIGFQIDIPSNLKEMIVPGEIRYQVTSIINEALNNISKYAQANHVWINFSKSNSNLRIIIRDDGVGFKKEEIANDKTKATGYGLSNMQKRVSRIKGTLTIHSSPGQGTSIEVVVPVS